MIIITLQVQCCTLDLFPVCTPSVAIYQVAAIAKKIIDLFIGPKEVKPSPNLPFGNMPIIDNEDGMFLLFIS